MVSDLSFTGTWKKSLYAVLAPLYSRRMVVTFFYLVVVSGFAFAQGSTEVNTKMTQVLQKVVDFFSSGWVKLVLILALIGIAFGMIMNKDNEALKKKLIMLLGAVVLLLTVDPIVSLFWDK